MTATTSPPAVPEHPSGSEQRDQPSSPSWTAALSGAVSAALALGLSELFAGLAEPVPSLVLAVGDGVIDLASGSPLKDLAVTLFGTNDKLALVIGTVVVGVIAGAGLGVAARLNGVRVAVAGFAAFAAAAVLATLANPLVSTPLGAVSALVSAAAGVAVLRWLLRVDAAVSSSRTAEGTARGRRELLRIGAGVGLAAGIAGALGRSFMRSAEVSAARDSVVLPTAGLPAGAAPPGASYDIDGLSPLFTPNEDFYRIDTALSSPRVDVDSWALRITGMVDQEISLTLQDLLALPQIEADITIACVSNEVGGDLIGNARWQGVRLVDVLDLAGVQPGATQIVGRSVDGWTAGFMTDIAYDGRDAMIAVAMNGEALPIDHGFPARLVVPGLYGYVSATKWLAEIELTRWEDFDGYWIPRGWSKEGPIKTQSRIDVPRQRARVEAGEVVVAGVAWAQRRGVSRVEVRVDGGSWQEAELAEAISIDTWRQWRAVLDLPAGQHVVEVRATDAEGMVQREERVPVAPDGAEGYHRRVVEVV